MLGFAATRLGRLALLVVAVLALGIATADARSGRGGSFGSRGARTQTAPPPTATAPNATSRQAVQPGASTARPGATAATSTASRFGGGFGGMLVGGLIGAGLFGLLSGHGLFGGMSGFASMLGLLLQIGLIVGAVYLIMGFIRSRSQPATAGAGPQNMARSGLGPQPGPRSTGFGGTAGGFGAAAAAPTVPTQPLTIVKDDYDAFQAMLGHVQDAYGREALDELRTVTTPDVYAQFAGEIAENRRNNVHNLVSDAKLLSGDLAEAWSEAGAEYATVAMRFEVVDTVVERGTGRILEGNASVPNQATELWTFVRQPRGSARDWKLSAIDQAA